MGSGAAHLSWNDVSARRLERSSLTAPVHTSDLAGVVRTLCGAHAQVLSAAELSIGMRVDGATRDDVRDALWERHTLVKAHGPRGTIHLLPTADLPMWIGALGSVPESASPFLPDVRMSEDQTEEVIAAIGKVLADAELTIDELNEAIIDATGPWAGDLVMPAFQVMWPRWRQATSLAARRGVLCFGPNRGRKVTYTNPQRFMAGAQPTDGPTAQAQLVRHYLHAYGPGSPQNFAQWLGVPRGFAAELFGSLEGEQIERVDFEGSESFVNRGDTGTSSAPPRGIRLLPYFDSYVVACRPRELLYPGRAAERALTPSGQAGNYPVLLVDGVVAGVWHQRRAGRKLHVTVEPLGKLTAAQHRELGDQVELMGTVLDGTPELTVGKVTAGAHA